MAKTETATKKLIPEVTQSERTFADPDFHLPGNYLMEHIPSGTLTSITPRTYERAFKNNSDFKVKKSPNK